VTSPGRDRRRRFSGRERAALAIVAGGKCRRCGDELTPDFHGDHVVAHARGGRTDVTNGQALCPACNRAKGTTAYLVLAPGDHAAHRADAARAADAGYLGGITRAADPPAVSAAAYTRRQK